MFTPKRLLALFVVIALAFAVPVQLEKPIARELNNGDIVDLGTIGPGQTVYLNINPKVSSGGVNNIGGVYDYAIVSDLPKGWTAADSKLYQDPIQITITANPDATEGDYLSKVTVVDENNGEKLGNVTFVVKVHVTWDVLDMTVSPTNINTGPGQPARFAIMIKNKGSTSDVFEISAVGQKRWEFRKPVFVPAQSSKIIYYEIAGQEEETYRSTISVVSLASKNIAKSQNVTMNVRSDLIGDYKATNNGVLLFPVFESPLYALAGLISNLFG